MVFWELGHPAVGGMPISQVKKAAAMALCVLPGRMWQICAATQYIHPACKSAVTVLFTEGSMEIGVVELKITTGGSIDALMGFYTNDACGANEKL